MLPFVAPLDVARGGERYGAQATAEIGFLMRHRWRQRSRTGG
jgi:hypothetical protein